jgi:Fe-S-cluster-containing dehydrogenase component
MAQNGKRAAQKERQVAMVFDLNKCIGCQTCSVAC